MSQSTWGDKREDVKWGITNTSLILNPRRGNQQLVDKPSNDCVLLMVCSWENKQLADLQAIADRKGISWAIW